MKKLLILLIIILITGYVVIAQSIPDSLWFPCLRLAIMSLLISVEKAEFTYIKEQTDAIAGNLSVQVTKLEEAGYIKVEKGFSTFEKYVNNLKDYLKLQLVNICLNKMKK